MDVHKETISIAVMNSARKLIMESIVETKTITILQFIQGLRGALRTRRRFFVLWLRAKKNGAGDRTSKADLSAALKTSFDYCDM
jgi:hypothetical protein